LAVRRTDAGFFRTAVRAAFVCRAGKGFLFGDELFTGFLWAAFFGMGFPIFLLVRFFGIRGPALGCAVLLTDNF
jgi:hypothetical protein